MKIFFILIICILCYVVSNNSVEFKPVVESRVRGNIQGLTRKLLNKLEQIAALCNSKMFVTSGRRSGGCRWHKEGKAADFKIDNWSSVNVYKKMKSVRRRLFDRHQVIYHTPGRRRCSTAEHMHIAQPDNYTYNSFCFEKKCDFRNECDFIRV